MTMNTSKWALILFLLCAVAATGSAQTKSVKMTNADIIQKIHEYQEKGFDVDEMIIPEIRNMKSDYDTSPNALEELRKNGASEKVIRNILYSKQMMGMPENLDPVKRKQKIAETEAVLKRNPGDLKGMRFLSSLYALGQQGEPAITWAQKAVSVDSKDKYSLLNLGSVCWRLLYGSNAPTKLSDADRERYAQTGIEALNKGLELDSNYAAFFNYLDLLYRETAKSISPDPDKVPANRLDEYNGYLSKASEYRKKSYEVARTHPEDQHDPDRPELPN